METSDPRKQMLGMLGAIMLRYCKGQGGSGLSDKCDADVMDVGRNHVAVLRGECAQAAVV